MLFYDNCNDNLLLDRHRWTPTFSPINRQRMLCWSNDCVPVTQYSTCTLFSMLSNHKIIGKSINFVRFHFWLSSTVLGSWRMLWWYWEKKDMMKNTFHSDISDGDRCLQGKEVIRLRTKIGSTHMHFYMLKTGRFYSCIAAKTRPGK